MNDPQDRWLRQPVDDPLAIFSCPLWNPLPPQKPGLCMKCEQPLPPRRKRWCSTECATWLYLERGRNHDWKMAREAALERDGFKCVVCGHDGKGDALTVDRHGRVSRYTQLEVNHIKPRRGADYSRSCRNHLTNLETVCRSCHKRITKRQQAEHADALKEWRERMTGTSKALTHRQILIEAGAIRTPKKRRRYAVAH